MSVLLVLMLILFVAGVLTCLHMCVYSCLCLCASENQALRIRVRLLRKRNRVKRSPVFRPR